ncbi:MAG: DNA primase [Patescibacteria group bacterium]|nr:DNA primase [Patescibacteria group bacterium]
MNHSEEIKAKIDIVELISQYLNLRPAGSNFRGVCPFHNEKTPSFMVSPEKQIWHCFGCGKGGDIFSFIMEMEGLDFVETLKMLAPRAGVVLDNRDFSENKSKNRLFEILELSLKYYNFILTNEKNKNENIDKIKKYLAQRGLNTEAINRWGIGYSLNNYDDLINFLKSKKYTDNEIFLSGMSAKSDRGKYFNRFRDRIMFPIKDANGRVLAFTARVNPDNQDKEKSFGKYINSPQTDLYDKSRVLFGLDKAKGFIKEKDAVIVVEGQMDVISVHEAGFKNVVASSGTALTVSQLNLIKRYTNNIILSFDQDLAGSGATDRGIAEALKMGLNLKVVVFNDKEVGKDPDEIIRENPTVFGSAIENSRHIIDYYLNKELKSLDLNNIDQKNKSVNKILTVINMLYNKVEQDFWIKEIGQKYSVNESFLREQLLKLGKNTNKINGFETEKKIDKNFVQVENLSSVNREDKLTELLMSLILRFPHNFDYLSNKLDLDQIPVKFRKFYEIMLIYYNQNNKKLDYNQFLDYIKGEQEFILDKQKAVSFFNKISLLADFYLYEHESDSQELNLSVKKEVLNIILDLKKIYYKNLIREKELSLSLAEKNNEKDKIESILEELKDLNDKFLHIN